MSDDDTDDDGVISDNLALNGSAASLVPRMGDRDPRTGRFLSGNKAGPGRPHGARDRHKRNFLEAMAEDFEKHGRQVIAEVRELDPVAWLKLMADLLPKEAKLDVAVGLFSEGAVGSGNR